MARVELGQKPWELNIVAPEAPPSRPPSIEEKARSLANFLSDSPIHFISIESVIPSTRIGIMCLISVVKTGSNSDTPEDWHTDNSVVDYLVDKLLEMSPDKSKKYKGYTTILKNLDIILEAVHDEFRWDMFKNSRKN